MHVKKHTELNVPGVEEGEVGGGGGWESKQRKMRSEAEEK